jgi:hypothetical protein
MDTTTGHRSAEMLQGEALPPLAFGCWRRTLWSRSRAVGYKMHRDAEEKTEEGRRGHPTLFVNKAKGEEAEHETIMGEARISGELRLRRKPCGGQRSRLSGFKSFVLRRQLNAAAGRSLPTHRCGD